MKKRIIVLPGELDAHFFLMELEYIKESFDEIVVLSYPLKRKRAKEISKKYKLNYKIIKYDLLFLIFSGALFSWLFSKETRREFSRIKGSMIQRIKKFSYMLFYGSFSLMVNKYINEIMESENIPTILYSYWLSRGAYSIAYQNTSRHPNIEKIVSRAHGYDLYEFRNPLCYLPFREYINNNLDEIFFISNSGKDYFLNAFPNNNGARKSISYLGTTNAGIEKQFGMNTNVIVIASCSAIIDVKRLDLIIDFIAGFPYEVEWIHVGDGELMDQMRQIAEEKISNRKYQFLGYLDNDQILTTYQERNVDFFVNLSDSEGIPVSIMEAMSMGIPIIARNVGGISELVNQTNGFLLDSDVDNKSFEGIYQEIHQMKYDRASYVSKSLASKSIWQSKFNAERNYRDFFSSLAR